MVSMGMKSFIPMSQQTGHCRARSVARSVNRGDSGLGKSLIRDGKVRDDCVIAFPGELILVILRN
jgi:hypothetical protein